jgi:DNA-directed RNA polymerase beta subunit
MGYMRSMVATDSDIWVICGVYVICSKLNKNKRNETKIDKIVKIGDHVKIGDPLAIFETVFDDPDAINLVEKIGEKFKEDIKELSLTTKKANYSGEIIDIKIYYNRDIEEFTPSVQKIIKNYLKDIKEKQKKIDSLKLAERPNIYLPITEKYENETEGKIKNHDVDGLLIEFYIRHADKMHLGDKITFQGACKTIVTETLKDSEAPFSEYNKEIPIDAIFSPLSLVTRMLIDLPTNLLGNKALIGLKEKVKELYEKS